MESAATVSKGQGEIEPVDFAVFSLFHEMVQVVSIADQGIVKSNHRSTDASSASP
jgi:hypothetical protein